MLEELTRLVRPDGVLPTTATGAFCVNGVLPRAVVEPGNREEVAALLLRAGEAGWAVVPYGGGTRIELGLPPRTLDLVLSTRRMDRVVDYQPDDMTVTVEPGLTLAALERLLASRGQFLPLDPPARERATAGGTVASAAAGPWRAGHGTPRDWLIGCRVVGTDGREIRGGGQVVKNVAGYDLPKLYTGSFGTLGLLTELTFKVMPQPEAAGYALVELPAPSAVEALTAAILDSHLQPSALELLNAAAAEVAGGPGVPPGRWLLFIQFLHASEAVAWQLEQLTGLAREAGGTDSVLDGARGARLLDGIRDLPLADTFAARLGTLSSRVTELSAAAVDCCAAHGTVPRIAAHAATGQIHVLAGPEASLALAADLRALAGSVGGTCLFPRLPSGLWGRVDPWGEVGPEHRLMRGIKETLDPEGVFSPGRFAGGL